MPLRHQDLFLVMTGSDHCVCLSTISSASKSARPTQRASVHMCCHAARDVIHSSSVPKSALRNRCTLKPSRHALLPESVFTAAAAESSLLHSTYTGDHLHVGERPVQADKLQPHRLAETRVRMLTGQILISLVIVSTVMPHSLSCLVRRWKLVYLRCLSAAAAASKVLMVLISSGTDSKYRQTWHASPGPHLHESDIYYKCRALLHRCV